jgi:hypothetical protein
MVRQAGNTRGGLATGALITGAVSLLALPSAVLAFTVSFDPAPTVSDDERAVDIGGGSLANAALSRNFPAGSLARGKLYPFTPASTPSRPNRSVTVAVRVDAETARAITVRVARAAATGQKVEWPEVRIAPTAFSLGVSRGYATFASGIERKDDPPSPVAAETARYSIASSGAAADSRFSPRIVMDETQGAGRAPRTFAGDSDDLVDVGGSYSVTRNLDVTAGVRYSQERERLIPPADGKQDSQAVYVGTQFRF